jgi:hypothetical protein
LPGRAAVPVAKGTVHVANIGDFHINAGVHSSHLLEFSLL